VLADAFLDLNQRVATEIPVACFTMRIGPGDPGRSSTAFDRSILRQPIEPDAERYDRITILFHWTIAILVVVQWLGAQVIDWFPSGPLRIDARSVHITLGVTVTALLAARLAWRATGGRRLPPAGQGVLEIAARATHWALYLLLIAMVSVGLFLTWTRGDSLFNLFNLPAYSPGDKSLARQVQELHATIGWLILAVAGLHAAAALVHRFVWRDGVLERMLPRA
jgi:cytochrome b561